MDNVTILVDVQNIYYTCREAYAKQFNYRKLWQQLQNHGEIVSAYAYAIDRGDQQQQKFQDALKHIGFEVKLKPFIQRSDGSAKGDWDVGITIDVLEAAADADIIVLLSGDGDFAILLDKLIHSYHCEAWAYGVPSLTAHALINAASRFQAIEQDLLQ